MSTGKQSPLGMNIVGSLLQNRGFYINPIAAGYMGASKTNDQYSFGSIVQYTCLRLLTWAINDGCLRGVVDSPTYNNLISIGSGSIPALGNAKPPTYLAVDPSGQWSGEATTGYYIPGNSGQGQAATWIPYDSSNIDKSITQWGYVRLHALQAWNEFNWNGLPTGTPALIDFTSSFLIAQGFIEYTNVGIIAAKAAQTYLDGVYSNMNDLITADIAGVSLALPAFGQDCITLGKAIDLSKIGQFGLPSVLLQTLRTYNALTQSVSLALLSSGLSNLEIDSISAGVIKATNAQEKLIYGAFLVIRGLDLVDVVVPLNCKTAGLESLADLLDLTKMFPSSYQSLTVPIYNETPGPTNSKTYYPIFDGTAPNSRIDNPTVNTIIGTIIPPGLPQVTNATSEVEQTLSEGFGSYLDTILPRNIAVTAGAFSYSMQQLKNVQYINFEKFAQIAASLEVTTGLDQVNGTTVPSDVTLATQAHTMLGLGSGPDRTYTMSDFFGCMSGVPYLWNDIKTGIDDLETARLKDIYRELFLAVTWDPAVVSISQPTGFDVVQKYEPAIINKNYDPKKKPSDENKYIEVEEVPGIYDLWYQTIVTFQHAGGGYGRGGTPAPVIRQYPNSSGNTFSTTIGTDDTDAASKGSGSFGRVSASINNTYKKVYYASVTINGPQAPTANPPVESVTIEAPPTAILPVAPRSSYSGSYGSSYGMAQGGTGTAGLVYTATSSYQPGVPIPPPTPIVYPGPTKHTLSISKEDLALQKKYKESVTVTPVTAEAGKELTLSISGGVPSTAFTWKLPTYPTGSALTTSGTGTLDANGVFTFAFTGDLAGNYSVEIEFAGTNHVRTAAWTSTPAKLGGGVVTKDSASAANYATSSKTESAVIGPASNPSNPFNEVVSLSASSASPNTNITINGSNGMPNTDYGWTMVAYPPLYTGTNTGTGTTDGSGSMSASFNATAEGRYVVQVSFKGTGHDRSTNPLIVTAASPSNPALPFNPTVALLPTIVAPNAPFTLVMTGWGANTEFAWSFDGPNGRINSGKQSADSTGSYTLAGIVVSDKGSYTFSAYPATGGGLVQTATVTVM